MIFPDWVNTTWGDIASLEYGKSLRDYKDTSEGYPVYGTNGQIGWHKLPLCDHPGIIIGRKGAYRGVHYSSSPFYVIDTAFYLNPKIEFDQRWAYYCLLTYDINAMDSGSAIPSLSRDSFHQLNVIIPPLPEQRKIADILSTVDEHIAETECLIDKTKILKQGLMQRLLTQGIGHTEFKDTEIGRIPAEWDLKTIGDCVENIIGGGTPSRDIDEYYNGSIPWVTVKDLDGSFYMSDAEEHITIDAIQKSASNLIPTGSIVVATRMALGRGFINLVDIAINQDLKALIPSKVVIPEFLLYYYLFKGPYIESQGSGTTVKGIRLELLRAIFAPIPRQAEQHQITSILITIDDNIKIYQTKLDTLNRLKSGLMQQLLTGKIRVKI